MVSLWSIFAIQMTSCWARRPFQDKLTTCDRMEHGPSERKGDDHFICFWSRSGWPKEKAQLFARCELLTVLHLLIWGFPWMGVPQNGWCRMENPIQMDDLGLRPIYATPHVDFIFIPSHVKILKGCSGAAAPPSSGSSGISSSPGDRQDTSKIHGVSPAESTATSTCRSKKWGLSETLKSKILFPRGLGATWTVNIHRTYWHGIPSGQFSNWSWLKPLPSKMLQIQCFRPRWILPITPQWFSIGKKHMEALLWWGKRLHLGPLASVSIDTKTGIVHTSGGPRENDIYALWFGGRRLWDLSNGFGYPVWSQPWQVPLPRHLRLAHWNLSHQGELKNRFAHRLSEPNNYNNFTYSTPRMRCKNGFAISKSIFMYLQVPIPMRSKSGAAACCNVAMSWKPQRVGWISMLWRYKWTIHKRPMIFWSRNPQPGKPFPSMPQFGGCFRMANLQFHRARNLIHVRRWLHPIR